MLIRLNTIEQYEVDDLIEMFNLIKKTKETTLELDHEKIMIGFNAKKMSDNRQFYIDLDFYTEER